MDRYGPASQGVGCRGGQLGDGVCAVCSIAAPSRSRQWKGDAKNHGPGTVDGELDEIWAWRRGWIPTRVVRPEWTTLGGMWQKEPGECWLGRVFFACRNDSRPPAACVLRARPPSPAVFSARPRQRGIAATHAALQMTNEFFIVNYVQQQSNG